MELIITKGWLKPSKLIQVTGTPAAELLSKKLAQEKEEAKRKSRMSKIKKLLDMKKDKQEKKRHVFHPQIEPKKKTQELKSSNLPLLKPKAKDRVEKALNKSVNKEKSNLPYLNKRNNNTRFLEDKRHFYKDNIVSVPLEENKIEDDQRNDNQSDALEGAEENEAEAYKNNTWRQYFSEEEIESAYNNISQGKDHIDTEEVNSSNSESESSEENDEVKQFINCLSIYGSKYNQMEAIPENATIEERDFALPRAQKMLPVSKVQITQKKNEIKKKSFEGPSRNSQKLIETKLKQSKLDYVTFIPFSGNRHGSDPLLESLGESNNQNEVLSLFIGKQPTQRKGHLSLNGRMQFRKRQITGSARFHAIQRDSQLKESNKKRNGAQSSDYKTFKGVSLEKEQSTSFENLNFQKPNESHPIINIKIKNINVQSFPKEYNNDNGNRLSDFDTSVIASIPKHADSKIFQKLFNVPKSFYQKFNSVKGYSRRDRLKDLKSIPITSINKLDRGAQNSVNSSLDQGKIIIIAEHAPNSYNETLKRKKTN